MSDSVAVGHTAGYAPQAIPRKQISKKVSKAELENILPSGMPIYDKKGQPIRVPDPGSEQFADSAKR